MFTSFPSSCEYRCMSVVIAFSLNFLTISIHQVLSSSKTTCKWCDNAGMKHGVKSLCTLLPQFNISQPDDTRHYIAGKKAAVLSNLKLFKFVSVAVYYAIFINLLDQMCHHFLILKTPCTNYASASSLIFSQKTCDFDAQMRKESYYRFALM